MNLEGTQYRLCQWARWVVAGGGVPGYRSPALALIRDHMGTVLSSPSISDDEGLLVDRAIGKLLIRDSQLGECVVLYYAKGLSIRALARELGVSKSTASVYLSAGTAWVDCEISRSAA